MSDYIKDIIEFIQKSCRSVKSSFRAFFIIIRKFVGAIKTEETIFSKKEVQLGMKARKLSEASRMKVKFNWIDCAKLIAIFAVIVDHTNGILYTNQKIALASYYSVSLFVFLAGISSYHSNQRCTISNTNKKSFVRFKKILILYVIATFMYQVYQFQFFDLSQYINYILNFNISGPFYFILFFCQLIIISPFLYHYIILAKQSKWRSIFNLFGLTVTFLVAAVSIKYSFILEVHGGGKYIFGGSYIILFCLGMIWASIDFKIPSAIMKWLHLVLSSVCCIAALLFLYKNNFEIDGYLPFGQRFNPPSISLVYMPFSLHICPTPYFRSC